MVEAPGVYDMPMGVYHLHRSLSSGVAFRFLTQSPIHAWFESPFNPDFAPTHEQKFVPGTVTHTLTLGKGERIAVIDADDYRTKAAREARDEAIDAGQTPILAEQYERACAMRDATYAALERHQIGNVFKGRGEAEQSVFWQEGEVWCRCRPDWLVVKKESGGSATIYSLKTTTNAHPNVFRNRVEQLGYMFKAAFYTRGLAMVLGTSNITYRWIVVETEPPHAVAVYEPDPMDMMAAEEDVINVIEGWGKCLREASWPAYPPRTMVLPASGYYRLRQEQRQESGEISPAAIDQAIAWQKEMMA